MTMLNNLELIPATKDHMNFVLVHWLKSNAEGVTKIDRLSGYYKAQKMVITHLLSTCDTLVLVNKDNHKHAVGYIVFDDSTAVLQLHYAYIKPEYRRLGLYNYMMSTIVDPVTCIIHTHLPKKWQKKYSMDHKHKYYPFSVLYSTLLSIVDPDNELLAVDPTVGLDVGPGLPVVEHRRSHG